MHQCIKQIILDLFIMKILVTGGAGFIGSHTVVELVHAGFEPIIVDNFSNSDLSIVGKIEKIIGRKISIYQIDCKIEAKLETIFVENPEIEGIIHFAAFKAVGESVEEPDKYYHNNIASLTCIFSMMKKYGVNKFVFSSSCTVYGNPEIIPVSEEAPIKTAINPYAHTKQLAEEILFGLCQFNKDIEVVLLRYFNPIGAHESGLIGELPIGVPNNLVPFITQTAAGWRDYLVIFGNDYETVDGTCIRDFIHVEDLAKAHVKALLWKNQNGNIEAFNIGSGVGHSVQTLIDAFIKATGVNFPVKYGERRAGDIPAIFASAEKAHEMLDWKAERTLEDALKHAWNWQQTLEKPE